MPAKRDPDMAALVSRVQMMYNDDRHDWDPYCDKFRSRWRSYRGVIETRSEAAAWTNKQHPAVVLESIETISANLIDAQPKWRLRARPIIDDQAVAEKMRRGAEANELLLNYQIGCDHWAEKQRPFDLQGLVCGITVSKQSWDFREGDVRSRQWTNETVLGRFGEILGMTPRPKDVTSKRVLRDDPTMEVVDVFDWFPHRSAKSLETCDRVHHRVWYTFDQLKEMEANGRYGVKAGGEPVDLVKDQMGQSGDRKDRGDIFDQTRHPDMIQVVESWIDRGRTVVTVGGNDVLLEHRQNPYWFDYLDHRFPFVVCSGTPDPFRIPGISEVELMAELQEMLWTLTNQRLDALQLLSNAIVMIADDVEDPDAFVFEPGGRWLVPRPVTETVKQWTPDPTVPQMTIAAESMLRQDIQDIVGASVPFQPAVGGGYGGQTATGMSIVTSLAQKRFAAKKQQFVWAKGRVGEQWCALNQQFIEKERLVPIIGREGATDWEEIHPQELQGVYAFETEMVDESMLRQERRAEKQSMLQVAVSSAPVFAMTGQPLNLKAYMEDYLEEFGVQDTERYFSAKPQQLPMAGQSGQPGPPTNGTGTTNVDLAAGPTSPSNANSLSGVAALQQMGAMSGGAANGQ